MTSWVCTIENRIKGVVNCTSKDYSTNTNTTKLFHEQLPCHVLEVFIKLLWSSLLTRVMTKLVLKWSQCQGVIFFLSVSNPTPSRVCSDFSLGLLRIVNANIYELKWPKGQIFSLVLKMWGIFMWEPWPKRKLTNFLSEHLCSLKWAINTLALLFAIHE